MNMNYLYLKNYKMFKESLDDYFEKWLESSDLKSAEKSMVEFFINDLKSEGKDDIVKELKYRLSDNGDFEIVMVDILENKLDHKSKSQFIGRNLVMSYLLDKRSTKLNQKEKEEIGFLQGLMTIYPSKGFEELKEKLHKNGISNLNILVEPLKNFRDRLKFNQDLMDWASQEEVNLNQETIDNINNLIEAIENK